MDIPSKEEFILELIYLKDKCLQANNYNAADKYFEKIFKLLGHYAPQKVEVQKKSIELSFGGWNPTQALPSPQNNSFIELPNKQIKDVEPLKDNE